MVNTFYGSADELERASIFEDRFYNVGVAALDWW